MNPSEELFRLIHSLLWLSSFVLVAVLALAWKHRREPLGLFFLMSMGIALAWALSDAIMLSSETSEAFRFWRTLRRPILFFIAPPLIGVVLHCVRRGLWLTGPRLAALYVIPLITTILFLIRPELIWTDGPEHRVGHFVFVEIRSGPWYPLHTVFVWAVSFTGLILLVLHLCQTPRRQATATWLLFVAYAIPIAASMIRPLGLFPPYYELTPVFFSLMGPLFYLAVARHGLLELVPLAHKVIADHLDAAILVVDRRGRITEMNTLAVQSGLADKNTAGQSVALWAQRHGLANLPHDRALAGLEFSWERPGKDSGTAELSLRPVRDRQDDLVGAVIMVRDITEKKLALAELRQAKEAAEQASRIKNQFIASMSHEIRTPLNAIMGFSKLMEQSADPKQATMLRLIHGNGETLLRLINDILDLACIEEGRFSCTAAACNPLAILMDVAETLRPKAQAKGLAVAVDASPALPASAQLDAVRLRQILSNLCDNAIKYSSAGKVCLGAAVNERDGHLELVFFVEDTGPGLPDKLKSQGFRAFERGVTKEDGVGLGLALCAQLAQAMEGTLEVESSSPRGTRMALHLPLRPAATQVSLPSPSPAADPAYPGRRVLSADDNAHNRLLLQSFLCPLGIEVIEAEDGRQALELLSLGKIDLVFMDLRMPVLDGLAATRELRRGQNSVPVVAVTASVTQTDEAEALAAGCDAFLRKPVDRDELLACLKRFLGGEQPVSASEQEPEQPLRPEASSLPQEIAREWQAVRHTLMLDQVRNFAETLCRQEDPKLRRWGRELRRQAESCDVGGMIRSLE